MEERQSFEKARNIEASILKKTKDPKLNGEQRPFCYRDISLQNRQNQKDSG